MASARQPRPGESTGTIEGKPSQPRDRYPRCGMGSEQQPSTDAGGAVLARDQGVGRPTTTRSTRQYACTLGHTVNTSPYSRLPTRPSDLTPYARIRNAALHGFATKGP